MSSSSSELQEFQNYLADRRKAVFWSNFLAMSDILHRFVYYQREGDWMGHLCESTRILPYLTTAGHYKYGQQYLPLYLSDMKRLPDTAPEVHRMILNGAFAGRRADGHHNGVSPEMLLQRICQGEKRLRWYHTQHRCENKMGVY